MIPQEITELSAQELGTLLETLRTPGFSILRQRVLGAIASKSQKKVVQLMPTAENFSHTDMINLGRLRRDLEVVEFMDKLEGFALKALEKRSGGKS